MQKDIRSWAEVSHDRDDGTDVGVYVQIKGHRVWLNTDEAQRLMMRVHAATVQATQENKR